MAVQFDYGAVRNRVTDVLHDEFGPNAAIRTDEGWHGRVHVKIVSSAFDGLNEDEKQGLVWSVLREKMGPESQAISLVLAIGTDEIQSSVR